ncbi:AraC family transcriptional regulator [Aestuariispira insulae]|uniref:AraC family transcriptional regulator n=1 Tax=Aestuariispira insulae TaxID=1461337 RepID=A0A3D9HF87_9PROT|nr:AraC family transcriptional regulator [Aestuariispira insulae]RED48144.1 AraC family transcriptional regulator [Aestuariispira insulae]
MKQFFKAIDYIEANLSTEIRLSDVANAACYSDYHFARMFRALAGDTIVGYIRKRRLSIAAERLVSEDIRLIDLALESGFDSQEAFSRAFRKLFGMAPGQFRRQRDWEGFMLKPALTSDILKHFHEDITMEPKIVEHAGLKAIGLDMTFSPEKAVEIPALWGQLRGRIPDIPAKTGKAAYGICSGKQPGDETFTYTACLDVSEIGHVPDGMRSIELPARTYAVFTHKVTSPDVPAGMKVTMQYIWGTWLPNSDYRYTGDPDFELTDDRFDPESLSGEIDIYIPVVPA